MPQINRQATDSKPYFPISTSMNVLDTGFGRGLGFSAVGGTGSFFSVLMEETRCVFESTPIVRAP